MQFLRTILLAMAIVHPLATHAQDTPPTDPRVAELTAETARLKAENDLLTQKDALIKAQYGAPATAPTGSITNPEKFTAMGQWTLAAATAELAGKAVDVWSGDGTPKQRCSDPATAVLITSSPDRQAQHVAADLIRQRLDQFTSALDGIAAQPRHARALAFGIAGAGAIVQGVVGTLDSLVGLFRADYTIGDLAVTSDDFTLRLAVASKLQVTCPGVAVVVDQLSAPSSASYPLITGEYARFSNAWSAARGAYAKEMAAAKNDAERARFADAGALLEAASAFDAALTTPVDGAVPLVNAAMVLADDDRPHWVLFVKFGTYSSSMITRKHLLSRNDVVTAVAGGQGQVVLFDTEGRLVTTRLFRIDKRVGGKLSEIVDSAVPLAARQD